MASAHHLAQAPRYSLPSMPGNDFRLPSLKDLNFQYRSPAQGQEGPPLPIPNGSSPAEHVGSAQSHPARQDPASWSRSSPSSVFAPMPPQHQHSQHPHPHPHQPPPPPAPPHQHSPPLSAGHEQQPSRSIDYGVQRHDNGGYLTPGLPLSAQVTPLPGTVTIGPVSRSDDSHSQQHSSKRSRANSNMGVPRDSRSAHASYSIQQNPQYSPQQQAAFHNVQPVPGPPPHEQVPQQPTHGGYSHQYGYVPPPQYIPPRPHNIQPQAHHQQQTPYLPPPPPQQDSWDQQQAPPPPQSHQHPSNHQQQSPPQQQYQPQQHQQMNFARTTPLIPQNVDNRIPPNYAEREQKMSEIIKHCTILHTFASRYAKLQTSLPHVRPPEQELNEMSQRAKQVVYLLEEYKRLAHPDFERGLTESGGVSRSSDDHRPPKRPWEEMAQEDCVVNDAAFADQYPATSKAQTTAEQDMEIIRTKRATSVAGGAAAAGQPKSKYRKRSRATPPGKCHSCNIRETPEWRRGPDGARTLCNACGLHYAKLMRKRDKQIAAEGQAPRIDMETLRASARAADLDKSHSRMQAHTSSSAQIHQGQPPNDSTPPLGPADQPHHQGSFQVVNMGPNGPSSAHAVLSHPSQGMVPSHDTGIVAPLAPWSESGLVKGHGYAAVPSQSFMRTSQHVGSNDTSRR